MKPWEWIVWLALRTVVIAARLLLACLVLFAGLLLGVVMYGAWESHGWTPFIAFAVVFPLGLAVLFGMIWLSDYYDALERKRISLHTEGGGNG